MVDLSDVLSSTASVQVQAYWDPISDATYNLHQLTEEQFARVKVRCPELVNMEWKQALELFNTKPAYPVKDYNTTDFQAFLPSSTVKVGDVWELDSEEILPFFRQFHSGATTEITIFSHRTPKSDGAKACLRAISPDYAEIVFRIHAQFVLDAPGVRLLPAQFAGRLVLDRKEGGVVEFSLSLPSRDSNVDVNAFRAADMAFIPRMELFTLASGSIHDIEWDTNITAEEARKKLAAAFYKFAEIAWTPIEETVELAKVTNRSIHALVLFGALDDESC